MPTTINWPWAPDDLKRRWRRAGYSQTPATLEREMETAVGVVSMTVGTTGPEVYTAELVLGLADVEFLKAFYRYTLKNGRLWFNAVVDVGGLIDLREIKIVAGSLRYEPRGPAYKRVSMNFRTRVGTEMTAEMYAALTE